MTHQMPSRGGVAGVKEDLRRAKEAGADYNPAGVGAAWTHNFLNQKPWHPSNFRNRMKTWEHEQASIAAQKEKEKAQAEFDAEREYLQTLSFLSPEEQQRYKDRQSISFMYQKPPGYEAALLRDKEAAEKKKQAEEAAASAAAAGAVAPDAAAAAQLGAVALPANSSQHKQQQQQQQQQPMQMGPGGPAMDFSDKVRLDPFRTMLQARAALHSNDRLAVKNMEGAYGGYGRSAENQQLLEDAEDGPRPSSEPEVDEAALLASLSEEDRIRVMRRMRKLHERQAREEQLREAEAVLLAAGFSLDQLPQSKATAHTSSSGSDSSSSTSSLSGESKGRGHGAKKAGRDIKRKSKNSSKRKRGHKSGSKKSKRHKRHK